jgi:hypothetical protein
MNRKEVIKALKKYFKIHELVGPRMYATYGDEAWFVFETDTLHCLLLMRVGIGKRFYLNNWFWGGDKTQRGYRDTTQQIIKDKVEKEILYVSGHPLGNAFDYVVDGMTAEEVREWIEDHQDIFPCKIRLEWKVKSSGEPITWVHFDTKWFDYNPKIYKFNV